MKGEFSLILSEDWPHVVLKHLSQRSALIRFTGDRPATETIGEDDLTIARKTRSPTRQRRRVDPTGAISLM
jgi:hypothetical protein